MSTRPKGGRVDGVDPTQCCGSMASTPPQGAGPSTRAGTAQGPVVGGEGEGRPCGHSHMAWVVDGGDPINGAMVSMRVIWVGGG